MIARIRKVPLELELGRPLSDAEQYIARKLAAAGAGASGLVDRDPRAVASERLDAPASGSSIADSLARRVWIREPAADRRIRRGDDFAGDAWRHIRTGELRYTAVGHELEEEGAHG